MKVSLVVASGVHEGKVIPITSAQFLIGRDPQCQLRPASQAVSKQHCAILLKDGKIFVKDFGSTNGTIINDEVVRNDERSVTHHDRIKVGPLDFTLRIEEPAAGKAGEPTTPTSDSSRTKAAAAMAAVKAISDTAVVTPVARPAEKKEEPAQKPKPEEEPDHDQIAAMLLGMGDDSGEKVPEGSTVMEIPTPELPPAEGGKPAPAGKPGPAKAPTREASSNAASEILKKMMRRTS